MILGFVLGCGLLACTSDEPASDPLGEAAPAEGVDGLIAALGGADRAALSAVLADGAVYVDAAGRAEGLDAIVAQLSAGEGPAWTRDAAIDEHHAVARTRVLRGAAGTAPELLFALRDDAASDRYRLVALLPAPPAEGTDEIVVKYQDAWNETDAAARAALLEDAWADDGHYVDPTAEGRGREALSAIIDGFQASLPGAVLPATSGALEMHGIVHFTWAVVDASGATLTEGLDVGQRAADGRLELIAGFFGPLEAAAGE
ncbi:hypothetical protein [Sorangium sp. So ce1078]|uniref:hypothetical protein n=1 Tax=Sorangium sp. So ce1078 TaxID=3133329 RepID=UPI003F6344C2